MVKKRMRTKNFSLGGLYTNFNLLKNFIPAIQNLSDGVVGRIDSVFGSFPTVIWNGGRNLLKSGIVSLAEARFIIEYFHSLNIPIRFVFTNSLIDVKHLSDYYSNEILSMVDANNDWIILSSPTLLDYVKKIYPDIKIVRSITTLVPENYTDIIDNIHNYDLTVLPVEYCFDNTIKLIPPYLREKCEILVNERCQFHCPHKLLHHRTISQGYLNFDCNAETHFCSKHNPKGLESSMILTNLQIDECFKLGYNHFKIAARNSKDALDRFCTYLLDDDNRHRFIDSFKYDYINN